MKLKLAKASGGKLPSDNIAKWGSVLLVAIFVLMLVGQLFAYEMLPDTIAGYGLVGEAGALLLGAVIVVLELATLPALLHMRLSMLARLVGWASGAAVLDIWLWLTGWGIAHGNDAVSGIFGAKSNFPSGWIAVGVLIVVALVYLVVFYRSLTLEKMFKQV